MAQAGRDGAEKKAAELTELIDNNTFDYNSKTLSVSASIGLVIFSGGESAEDLLRKADERMYEMKKKTKGSRATEP